jgi:hypothetical protein
MPEGDRVLHGEPLVIRYAPEAQRQLDLLAPTGDAAILARITRQGVPSTMPLELPLWLFTGGYGPVSE